MRQFLNSLPPSLVVRNGRFEESEVTKINEHFEARILFERHPMSSQSLNHDWSHEITLEIESII